MTFTPAFRRTVDMINRDLHVIPLVQNAVRQCAFPEEFTVTFRSYAAERKPDGWFHPSSHPTMGERRLYYYLAEPDKWQPEPFDYGPRMSVLMGSAMHDLVEVVMIEMGLLAAPTGTCVCCERPHGRGEGLCDEWGVRDDVLGRRGHMDGILNLPGWGAFGTGVFDLKTASPQVIRSIQDNDLDAFRKKWPGYYGQAQEYMALTGLQQTLVLFLAMSEGWDMREFTIPRDEQYIVTLETKYRAVRNYVREGIVPPVPCCSSKVTARRCGAVSCPIKVELAA